MKKAQRCRILVGRVMLEVLTKDLDAARIFLAGFVAGQCEKVFLGVCPAAMFAYGGLEPMSEKDFLEKILTPTANVYGLAICIDQRRSEAWVTKHAINDIDDVINYSGWNTPLWTEKRARLCGIPTESIDFEYDLEENE